MNADMRVLKQLPVILMTAVLCAGAPVMAPGLPILLESEGSPFAEQGVVTRRVAPVLRAMQRQILPVASSCREQLATSRRAVFSSELLPLRDVVRRLQFALRGPPLP
jgi:hypothetical protein